MHKYLLFLVTSWLVFVGSVTAEESAGDFLQSLDLTLDELLDVKVASATKTQEQTSEAPAVITVITRQDIQAYGYTTVAEALSHVTSFIDNYDLAIHNFGVRGINSGVRSGSRTIKFMIDGQPIAFAANTQHFIDRELIPMHLVERIEVVRGPVSALYGANAFLGMVNIVTRQGDLAGQLQVETGWATHGENDYHLSAVHGGGLGDWQYKVGIQLGREDRTGVHLPRRSPDYLVHDRKIAVSDRARPAVFYGQLSREGETGKVNLVSYLQRLDVENPFSDINPLRDQGASRIALRNAYLRADYERSLGERTTARIIGVYSQGDTLDDDRIEVGADSFFFDRRFGYDGLTFGGELLRSLRTNDSLLIGFDVTNTKHRIETFSRVGRRDGSAVQFSPNRNETIRNTGVYVQYLGQVNDNWRGILGYRFDDESIIGSQSSLRLGLVGRLPKKMVLKLLAGSSFQAPSSELLFRQAVQAGDIIGNPQLKAQEANTIEASLQIPIAEYLQLSGTLFSTRVDDLLVYQTDDNNLFATNSSEADTKGVELEARFLWRGINAYFNYSWQDTQLAANARSLFVLENRLVPELFPEQAANIGAHYYWAKPQLRIAFETRWVDKRPASTQNVLDANQFYSLDSYTDSTLTASTDRFSLYTGGVGTLTFRVTDAFDHQYVNPGFGGIDFPSLGRRFSISFEQRF